MSAASFLKDARIVRSGFWDKVRRTLRIVPFLEDAIAAFFAAVDPATPKWVKGVLFGALAYFILPIDGIPDILGALGYADDLAVLMGAIRAVEAYITPEHRARAGEALAKLRLS